MKIIAGKYGGRRLVSPKNNNIRPTSDKVRGAMFNMLVSRGAVAGAHVLDAFCGSGALGLEALSRGAKSCHFIDKSRTSLALARENAVSLGLDCDEYGVKYVLGDARKVVLVRGGSESVHGKCNGSQCGGNVAEGACECSHKYGLVFLDPPYRRNLVADVLGALKGAKCLYDGAWIMCESERGVVLDNIDSYRVDSVRKYGDIKVNLLQYDQTYIGGYGK